MALDPFASAATVVLASTLVSQTTTVPSRGAGTLVAYNAGPNVVYLKSAATVAVPAAGVWTDGVTAIAPGSTQSVSNVGGTLAYIAETAGGALYLSIGEGS